MFGWLAIELNIALDFIVLTHFYMNESEHKLLYI